MILIQATIKCKGYDPEDLSHSSKKRICYSCDICGRVGWITKQNYNNAKYSNLCRSCSISDERSYMFGKSKSNSIKEKISKTLTGNILSLETKRKMVKNHPRKFGKDAPNWKGGIAYDRSHVLTEVECIKLNSRFNNSEFHHITKSIGIYIPKELHHHFYHNLKIGINMGSMNMLALQFINGGL